jgi:transcriptional regulator with XRE-family HTH domain
MGTRPEYDFKIIGRNLRRLRIRQKLSVEDVREYMQLGTVQAIYKWERGDSLPQADSLLALMELYHVHNFDVLTREDNFSYYKEICSIYYE